MYGEFQCVIGIIFMDGKLVLVLLIVAFQASCGILHTYITLGQPKLNFLPIFSLEAGV
jgi:hypothetical protein